MSTGFQPLLFAMLVAALIVTGCRPSSKELAKQSGGFALMIVRANRGDVEAQFSLGEMFSKERVGWMLRAVQVQTNSQPNDYHQQVKTDLEERLAPEQIAGIRQRAKAAATQSRRQP